MSLHERTLDVIQAFYDAAMDESLWRGALESLCDVTESQAASFWVLDGSEEPRLPTFICINFDTSSIKEYLEHTAAIDPTVRYLVSHPREPIVHDGLVITEREKVKHPYYDWHMRNVETRFRMVGQVRMAPKVQAGVALHRTRKAGRYEPRDISRFSVLHRHLERALAIGFRLSTLGAMQQAAAERFERSPAAVFFLDEHQRVVFSNRNAREMISAKDGVHLRDDGIVLARKQDDDKLQGLVSQAISPIVLPDPSHGAAMRALRPSGKRPYGVLVSSVSGNYPLLSGLRPAVCVVISDPDRNKPLPNHRLQAAFGLTGAEARLAARLAAGEDLRSAAGKLEITYGTARSRLAQIFQKTETRRQGELIQLLLATLGVE
jgi:DNA-binding CsgD family transcriptional regulator/PAS domain-containing protein